MMTGLDSLEKSVEERLISIRKERTQIRDAIESYESEIKTLLKKVSGFKESEQSIQNEIDAKEKFFQHTSMSKEQERLHMMELERLNKKKQQIIQNNSVSVTINSLKNKVKALRAELINKEKTLEEMQVYLRRINLSTKLKCRPQDLVEHIFNIKEENLYNITSDHTNLIDLEQDYNVLVDIDHVSSEIKLTGLSRDIQKAAGAIQILMDTITEEVPVTKEFALLLFADKSTLFNDLTARYSVYLEYNSSKNTVLISGRSIAVQRVKEEIGGINASKAEVSVDASLIPSIIGKGGSNLNQIKATYNVVIDIDREKNTVKIIGQESDVKAALNVIKGNIDENREIEDEITISKRLLFNLLYSPINPDYNLRTIAKDFNLKLEVESKSSSELNVLIKLKGTNTKMKSGKEKLIECIKEYEKNSLNMEVAEEIVPILLGKNGSNLNALRESAGQNVSISIDGNVVHIYSLNVMDRLRVQDEINKIIGSNYIEKYEFTSEFCTYMKSSRTSDLREKIQNQYDLNMNIDNAKSMITLRGNQVQVKMVLAELINLFNSFAFTTFVIEDNDEFNSFVRPSLSASPTATENAPAVAPIKDENTPRNYLNYLELKYDIDIITIRASHNITFRGEKNAVNAAIEEFSFFREGNLNAFSLKIKNFPLELSTIFIGKSGSNIKKVEDELDVKFVLSKKNNELKIFSYPLSGNININAANAIKEKILRAKFYIEKFISQTKITDTINLSGESLEDLNNFTSLIPLLRTLDDFFNVYATQNKSKTEEFTFKGSYSLIIQAKQFFLNALKNKELFFLLLPAKHIDFLKKNPRILAKFNNDKIKTLFVTSPSTGLTLQGQYNEDFTAIKKDFIKSIHQAFPSSTAFMALPRSCLRENYFPEFLYKLEKISSFIYPELTLGCLWVSVNEDNYLKEVTAITDSLYSAWFKKNARSQISPIVLNKLLTNSGTLLNNFLKKMNFNVIVDRLTNSIEIKVQEEDQLEEAKQLVSAFIKEIEEQYKEITIEKEYIQHFIGKKGAHINKLREKFGVNFDISPEGIIAINGPKEKFDEIEQYIIKFVEEEKRNKIFFKETILTPENEEAIFNYLLNNKGENIKKINKETSSFFTIDKEIKSITLKCKAYQIESAEKIFNDHLASENISPCVFTFFDPKVREEEEKQKKLRELEEKKKQEALKKSTTLPANRIIPGASPEIMSRQNIANLSKSSLRRLRRKERAENEKSND